MIVSLCALRMYAYPKFGWLRLRTLTGHWAPDLGWGLVASDTDQRAGVTLGTMETPTKTGNSLQTSTHTNS